MAYNFFFTFLAHHNIFYKTILFIRKDKHMITIETIRIAAIIIDIALLLSLALFIRRIMNKINEHDKSRLSGK